MAARAPAQPSEADIFHAAVDIVQGLPKAGPIQSSYDEKLAMYSLYKQATEGPPNMPRPGMFDMLGRAKWDAWDKQKSLSSADAMMAYVDVLLQVLHKYGDNADARAYIAHLEQMRGRDANARRRARRRSRSGSSRSSASSASSFHEASDAEYTYGEAQQPGVVPPPIAGPSTTHLAPPPHIPTPIIESVPPANAVQYPQDSPRLWQNPRRGSNASSIALGGDAASLQASRPPSRAAPGPHHAGTAPLSAQTLSAGQAYAQQVYRSHSQAQTDGERQLRQAIDERLPEVTPRGQAVHPAQAGPSAAVAADQDRPLPRIPLHSPLGTPRFDYRDRLSPVATFHATPYASNRLAQDRHRPRPSIDGFVRSFTPGPTGGIDLPLALQQIQTSLTALHERISSLEEAQTRILTQPNDPFSAVLRLFLPSRGGSARHRHRHGQRRALPIRLVWRLLNAARRAALDVLFLLLITSLSIGVWVGIRGRGRGGRTAIVQFWRMAYSAGRMLVSGLPMVQQIAGR